MRFAGTKEAGDPDAHIPGNGRIIRTAECLDVGIKKIPEMTVKLARDHIFFQLLPDDGIILLFSFDHAIDGAEYILFKQGTNLHDSSGVRLRDQTECSIIILGRQSAEQAQALLVVDAGIEHDQRGMPHT
mgnify:CR=1 FL=1